MRQTHGSSLLRAFPCDLQPTGVLTQRAVFFDALHLSAAVHDAPSHAVSAWLARASCDFLSK